MTVQHHSYTTEIADGKHAWTTIQPIEVAPLYRHNPVRLRQFFLNIYEEINSRVFRGYDPLPPFEEWLGAETMKLLD